MDARIPVPGLKSAGKSESKDGLRGPHKIMAIQATPLVVSHVMHDAAQSVTTLLRICNSCWRVCFRCGASSFSHVLACESVLLSREDILSSQMKKISVGFCAMAEAESFSNHEKIPPWVCLFFYQRRNGKSLLIFLPSSISFSAKYSKLKQQDSRSF